VTLCAHSHQGRRARTASGRSWYGRLRFGRSSGWLQIRVRGFDSGRRLQSCVPALSERVAPYSRRALGIEIERCAGCGGRLAIIAGIEEPAVIAKILAHLERTAPDQ